MFFHNLFTYLRLQLSLTQVYSHLSLSPISLVKDGKQNKCWLLISLCIVHYTPSRFLKRFLLKFWKSLTFLWVCHNIIKLCMFYYVHPLLYFSTFASSGFFWSLKILGWSRFPILHFLLFFSLFSSQDHL